MKTFITIVLAILIILIGFLLYVFDTAFYNPKRKRNRKVDLGEQYRLLNDKLNVTREAIKNTSYEKVQIISFDGTRLNGKYYHFKDNAPIDIIFHGYRSKPENDCGGGFMLSKEFGHNVLLPEHRAHGESEAKVITFGIKERYDCLQWVKYLTERFNGVKIFITGVSMGAATVLMASDLDLPDNVKGVIADCSYSSPKEIILLESKKMGFPQKLAEPFISLSSRIFAGFNWIETSPEQAVKNAKVPVLIIHGEDDRFVPCDMCYPIYNACKSPKKLFTVKDAGHGLSFIIDKEGYKKAVNEFKTAALNDDMSYFE